ncbi:MAG: transferase [Methylobacter sp.]|uniref:acyltransferase n=1 Tax=Methylobacter sp. TaxID=2051955 RepID=UPI002730D053|nr:transferase [Methylobacter sp.]MDP1666447.1 transferase [Methylobacter sp.]
MLRHLLNFLLLILPPSRCFWFRRLCLKLSDVEIGENVSVCGRGWIYGRGQLRIGRDTWLSPGVIFYTHTEVPILIGECCDIGPAIEFIKYGHSIGKASRRVGTGTIKPIMINDDCVIGAGSRILSDVNTEAGSVAVGSVVKHDVQANVLIAGVSAVFKKKFT